MRIKHILQNAQVTDELLKVQGWIKTKRDSGAISFIELTDGSSLKGLQIILNKDNFDNNIFSKLTTGASVEITGKLVQSPSKNQSIEMKGESISIVGECPSDYILQKKRHSFEFLREIAHLRGRTNTIGAVMRVRNQLSYAIHKFFQERDFVYIHSPIITSSDAEGAGEMFKVTTLDLEKAAQGEKLDLSEDFFGHPSALSVSGQLNAETYALALKDVYTFAPTFRAENSNTVKHLAEFWMIEPEMAFCNVDGLISIAQEFLQYVVKYVLDNSQEDLELFDQWIEKGLIQKLHNLVDSDFKIITYTQAIEELEKIKKDFDHDVSWGMDLKTEHEKALTELFNGPVIVKDYPKDIKAFYMKQNDDNKTVAGIDVLVPRLGEIIGGSEREDNLEKLETRMKEMDLDLEHYSWYLDLRRYGSVPHAGFGLGFERLVQYVTGMTNIRDVIPFPRSPKQIKY